MGSDSEFNMMAIFRDEASRILGPNPSGSGQRSPQWGGWTRANVAKMTKADSVMRETLRMQSFAGRNVVRKVLVDALVTDSGAALPKGWLEGPERGRGDGHSGQERGIVGLDVDVA